MYYYSESLASDTFSAFSWAILSVGQLLLFRIRTTRIIYVMQIVFIASAKAKARHGEADISDFSHYKGENPS